MTNWVDNHRASGLRPLQAEEIPYLEALGAELRRLRNAAGLTQAVLAHGGAISAEYLRKLEHGVRRTRLTTLRRLATVLGDGDERAADSITDHLAALAGPTLAPSNRFSNRREQNRARREAKINRLAAAAMPIAEEIAETMVREMLVGHRLVPLPKRVRQPDEAEPQSPKWARSKR